MAGPNEPSHDTPRLPTGRQLHREAEQIAVPAFDWIAAPVTAVVDGLPTLAHPHWHMPHWHFPHLRHRED